MLKRSCIVQVQDQILDLKSQISHEDAFREEQEERTAAIQSNLIHERERVQELSGKLLEAKVQLENMVNLMSGLQVQERKSANTVPYVRDYGNRIVAPKTESQWFTVDVVPFID